MCGHTVHCSAGGYVTMAVGGIPVLVHVCVYSESRRCAKMALCVLVHMTTDPVAEVPAGSREVVMVVVCGGGRCCLIILTDH